MTNATDIVVFADNTSALTFSDKKGNLHAISPEGALYKGGAALTALKDVALQTAFNKAANGRFYAAADIIATGFAAYSKATDKLLGNNGGKDKHSFLTLCVAVMRAEPKEGKGWTQKQLDCRALAASYIKLNDQREAERTLRAMEAKMVTDDQGNQSTAG